MGTTSSTILSQCYNPIAILLLYHPDSTLSTLSSQSYHPKATFPILPSQYYLPNATILMLLSQCYQPDTTGLTLRWRCYRLTPTISTLRPSATVLTLLSQCNCPDATIPTQRQFAIRNRFPNQQATKKLDYQQPLHGFFSLFVVQLISYRELSLCLDGSIRTVALGQQSENSSSGT